MRRLLGWIVVAVLLGAAAFELALALGAGSIGPQPGQGVTGEGIVSDAAAVALLAGVVLGLVYATRPCDVAALLAPSAAAYLVAFYPTYDPYYAPSLRRYSEGNSGLGLVAVVAALAVGAGVLTRFRPREGSVASSIMLLVVLVAVALVGDGH